MGKAVVNSTHSTRLRVMSVRREKGPTIERLIDIATVLKAKERRVRRRG